MAWRVEVEVKEFDMEFDYGPGGAAMKGNISKLSKVVPLLAPNQVPQRVTIGGNVRDCDLFVMSIGGGRWIVSQRFKEIVEALEPNVHNWFPTVLQWSSSEKLAEPYYFLQIGQELDTIIFERSSFTYGETIDGEPYAAFPRVGHLMTFDKKKIQGKHLWREKYCTYREIFFSNELLRNMKKSGFWRCFSLLECREENE